MKKLMKWMVGLSALMMSLGAQAAVDFTALETEIGSAAGAVSAVAGGAIVAGFGVFVLIWGAKKIKGALSSGA